MWVSPRLLAGGLAGVALLLSAGAAFASPGQATASVNVRSGPGTSYRVIDSLYAGETVDVQNCSGAWCYVVHSGPDGWVAANYLAGGDDGQGPVYYDEPEYIPSPVYINPPVYLGNGHHRPPFQYHRPPHGNPPPPPPVQGHPPHRTPHFPHGTFPGNGSGGFPQHVNPPSNPTPHVNAPTFTPRPQFNSRPQFNAPAHMGNPAGQQNPCQLNPELCQPHTGGRHPH